MEGEANSKTINLKMFDFVKLDPSCILSISSDQQDRLYVSRQHYSEIYQIGRDAKDNPMLHQIAEL